MGGGRPLGATRMSRGYQVRPKIHVIRVVFQDQALYARTSFRGAKTCKIGKKGCVFGHIDKFWKELNRQIKKNACKNAYLGYIFIPDKYVIRVLFVKSMDKPDTPSCHSSGPPGGRPSNGEGQMHPMPPPLDAASDIYHRLIQKNVYIHDKVLTVNQNRQS